MKKWKINQVLVESDNISLQNDYLNKKFDAENFNLLFYRIWFKNRDQSTLLEQDFRRKSVSQILIDSKAKKFSELINSIFSAGEALTDEFNENLTDLNDVGISEDEFREEIKEIFIKIQNLLNEE